MVTEEQRRQSKKTFLELYENKNTTYQDLWDTAKAVLRGKFVVMNEYIKKRERERSQINNLMTHLKLLEKQEQVKSKIRWKEIIKIRTEINEMENRKKHKESIKQKVGSLKRQCYLFGNISKPYILINWKI
jgi:hypothetical protein